MIAVDNGGEKRFATDHRFDFDHSIVINKAVHANAESLVIGSDESGLVNNVAAACLVCLTR
jgi:hypothetical protein